MRRLVDKTPTPAPAPASLRAAGNHAAAPNAEKREEGADASATPRKGFKCEPAGARARSSSARRVPRRARSPRSPRAPWKRQAWTSKASGRARSCCTRPTFSCSGPSPWASIGRRARPARRAHTPRAPSPAGPTATSARACSPAKSRAQPRRARRSKYLLCTEAENQDARDMIDAYQQTQRSVEDWHTRHFFVGVGKVRGGAPERRAAPCLVLRRAVFVCGLFSSLGFQVLVRTALLTLSWRPLPGAA